VKFPQDFSIFFVIFVHHVASNCRQTSDLHLLATTIIQYHDGIFVPKFPKTTLNAIIFPRFTQCTLLCTPKMATFWKTIVVAISFRFFQCFLRIFSRIFTRYMQNSAVQKLYVYFSAHLSFLENSLTRFITAIFLLSRKCNKKESPRGPSKVPNSLLFRFLDDRAVNSNVWFLDGLCTILTIFELLQSARDNLLAAALQRCRSWGKKKFEQTARTW